MIVDRCWQKPGGQGAGRAREKNVSYLRRQEPGEVQRARRTRKGRGCWQLACWKCESGWDFLKRRKWGHGRRILHKEHRGRQSAFVTRARETRESQTGRAGACLNRRFGWRARAHPSLDSKRGGRKARSDPRVWDRCVLRLMELGGCGRCGHPPTRVTVSETDDRRYRWRCRCGTPEVSGMP